MHFVICVNKNFTHFMPQNISSSEEKKILQVRFHFFSLSFNKFKETENVSNRKIINSVFGFLNRELQEGRGRLIDRHKTRKGVEQRVLFIPPSVTMLDKKRILGTIALLKNGRILVKPKEHFTLVPFDEASGEIYERAHFVIDFSTDNCIICLEFNNSGPRMSDLEFYIKELAEEKEYARSTNVNAHMDLSIDKAISEISNVLQFTIKAEPKKLTNLDLDEQGYLSGMNALAQKLKPKAFLIKAYFQNQGKKIGKNDLNPEATSMIKLFLSRFKKNPDKLDNFDNFVVKYEDKEGVETSLDLLKGKKEIYLEVDLTKPPTRREMYALIESQIDDQIIPISEINQKIDKL